MEKYIHRFQAEGRAKFIRQVCDKNARVEYKAIKNRHTDKIEYFFVVIVEE